MTQKSPLSVVRSGKQTSPEWVTTRTALSHFDVDAKTLYRHKESGLLRLGTHYLDLSDPNATKGSYRWNIAALTAAWSVPPEYREPATA